MTGMFSRVGADAAAAAWVALFVLAGGAVSSGIVVNGLLQIAAGLLLITLLARRIWSSMDRAELQLLTIGMVAALIGLLSLIPLPPGVWTALAGRADLVHAYLLARVPLPWLPISLVPDATIAALLSLLPPAATFLLVHALPASARRTAVIALAVMAFVSVLFGVLQQVGGYQSSLYLYQYSSRGGAVGFFANRNHLATMCLMVMPFLAALIASNSLRRRRSNFGESAPSIVALLLLIVGTLVVQSRAGWILLVPTALACLLIAREQPRPASSVRTVTILVGIVVALAAGATLFLSSSLGELFDVGGEVGPRQRQEFMLRTWSAIRHAWPIGTGWGSFTLVYPSFENPATVSNVFINHAHNDYLEFFLETGLAGVAVLVAFLLWWAARIRAVWQSGGDPVARAATVSIGVLLAHSLLDYPVRTAAIGCILALCCALTCVPTATATSSREERGRRRERTSGVIMLGAGARSARRDPPSG